MMQAVESQPWRISVQARAKRFRFKASKLLPSWRFYGTRFSILLKPGKFLLEVKSEPAKPATVRRKTFKSRLRRISAKLLGHLINKSKTFSGKRKSNLGCPERRPWTNFPANRRRRFLQKGPVYSLFIANLTLLYRSIAEKDEGRFLIHAITVLACLGLLSKKNKRRNYNLMVISTAFLVSFAVLCLNYVGI